MSQKLYDHVYEDMMIEKENLEKEIRSLKLKLQQIENKLNESPKCDYCQKRYPLHYLHFLKEDEIDEYWCDTDSNDSCDIGLLNELYYCKKCLDNNRKQK